MAQIIGSGDPVNPALASFFDTSIDFSGLGLVDRFEFRAGRVVAADDGGVQRVSAVLPTGTGRSLLQNSAANRPQHIPGGGPNGMTDALFFNRTRADGMVLGNITAGTMTKVLICRPEINLLPAGSTPNMHLLGTPNSEVGRVSWILRQVSGQLQQWANAADSTPNGASVQQAGVPVGAWMALMMTTHVPTRTAAVAHRAAGAAGWTWLTATWAETASLTRTLHTLGARDATSTLDGYQGRMAGGLTFVGRDARTDATLLDQINAWAFGPNSLFGL